MDTTIDSSNGRENTPDRSKYYGFRDLSFGIPTSYIVAPGVAFKAGYLGTTVLLGTLMQPWFGRPIPWGEVIVYTLLGPCSLVVAVKTWQCLPNRWDRS